MDNLLTEVNEVNAVVKPESQPYCLLDAKDLRRILPFRAIRDIRYYLNGVHVEPRTEGCRLVATNGHMIAVVNSPNSFATEPFILRTEQYLCDAIQMKSVRHGKVRVADKHSHVELLTAAGQTVDWMQAGPAFIDGRFPDWEKLLGGIDESKPGILGAFQAKYIRRALGLILKSAEREAEGTVTFFQKDPDSAIAIRSRDILVMIMPMRSSSVSDMRNPLPEWL
jgi:hypothetical protein